MIKILGAVYLAYSILTDIIIWGTALYLLIQAYLGQHKLCQKSTRLVRVFFCLPDENDSHSHSAPLDKKFWRPRASSSTMTIFFRVPRAIISSSATIVKSFLRVCTKLFWIAMVFWRGRADYTVVERRCQVLFTGKVQIFKKRSLGAPRHFKCKCEICQELFAGFLQIILLDKSSRVWHNLGKFGKTP